MSRKYLEENLRKAYEKSIRQHGQQGEPMPHEGADMPLRSREDAEIIGKISLEDLKRMLDEADAKQAKPDPSKSDLKE
ncbi:MAG: hypothetical protein E7328_00290 [Clostridiales bacterium]|nr:hypothetical protein [Clostridiales bacterium]